MQISRQAYNRFVDVFAELFSDEITVVAELENGDTATTIVSGSVDGLHWRGPKEVELPIPESAPRVRIDRLTYYNEDWVPVIEAVVDPPVWCKGGDVLRLNDLRMSIDLPVAPSRLEASEVRGF